MSSSSPRLPDLLALSAMGLRQGELWLLAAAPKIQVHGLPILIGGGRQQLMPHEEVLPWRRGKYRRPWRMGFMRMRGYAPPIDHGRSITTQKFWRCLCRGARGIVGARGYNQWRSTENSMLELGFLGVTPSPRRRLSPLSNSAAASLKIRCGSLVYVDFRQH